MLVNLGMYPIYTLALDLDNQRQRQRRKNGVSILMDVMFVTAAAMDICESESVLSLSSYAYNHALSLSLYNTQT